MNSVNKLPDNYILTEEINIKDDKDFFKKVNVISISILFPFLIIFFLLYDFKINFVLTILYFLLTLFFFLLIVVWHESIHGFFFKLGNYNEIEFKFHGFAASCGAPGFYYYRNRYMLVSITPFSIINTLLLVLLYFVKGLNIFPFVLFLTGMHLSGCSADLLIFFKLMKYDKDLLIEDTGINMKFYEIKHERVIEDENIEKTTDI